MGGATRLWPYIASLVHNRNRAVAGVFDDLAFCDVDDRRTIGVTVPRHDAEDMAACRDGTEEMMSKKPEERLNILPTSFALQMSSQKNERGLPQTDFACWKRA
jgi:hypothetical protein